MGKTIPIDFSERQIIQAIQHLDTKKIAATLNRSERGIRDELKRGISSDGVYTAVAAQEQATRKIIEGKKKVLNHVRSRKKTTLAIIGRIENIENHLKTILEILGTVAQRLEQ